MPAISRTTTIAAPAHRAWALVRDFDAMPLWNDTVRASRIEDGPADRVGCRRVLTFDDGGIWTHALTRLDDATMALGYSIIGTPQPMRIPVWNYHAVMQVRALSAESCEIEWQGRFETDHPEDMARRAAQVFDSGLSGLRRCLLPG
jgi:hypothetical protein